MIAPPIPANESERIAALERYGILDTGAEAAFDELARLASTLCGVPIALISLVDTDRQWFKARVGIDTVETPRDISFCAHALSAHDLFIVEDALSDVRFADNPFVTGEANVRFYAGAQLRSPEGLTLGTLCVIDTRPRVLTDEQKASLNALARQVMVQLELRRQIAERSAAERELDRFFDVSIELLAICDMCGSFRRLNPAFEGVLGYRRDELVGRSFIDLVHPDDRAATVAELQSLGAGAKTAYFENRYLRKDGAVRWLAWSATPIQEEGLIYAAARDITGAKLAEEELRRSDARTRSIIENALGGLITTNERGYIESVNPAASRMFRYEARELIGQRVCVLVDGEYASDRECLAHLRDAALGRVTEWRGKRSDGESFACELSLFEFYTGDDQRHFAAHMLDISERHEVDRMKSDFVATVSHELRTPLTSIRGSLGLLASGAICQLSPEARQLVSVAERNSVRLIALINDILDFEKLESGKVELDLKPVPVLRVIERSIESVSAAAQQEDVRIEMHGANVAAFADETRLTQVVVNLLSNAVKYSPPGSVVAVRSLVENGHVEVRVEDRGIGISETAQKRLFERFHQVDASDARRKPGTGLGLAICKAIVAQHGGTIGVSSRQNEGSVFWFRVPRDAREIDRRS